MPQPTNCERDMIHRYRVQTRAIDNIRQQHIQRDNIVQVPIYSTIKKSKYKERTNTNQYFYIPRTAFNVQGLGRIPPSGSP